MSGETWQERSARQGGLLARRELSDLAVTRGYLRAQIEAGRWRMVAPTVVATFTGHLDREQLMWCGILHAGPHSMVAGLTAASLHGLKNWHRDEVTILVPAAARAPRPLPGLAFVRTTHDTAGMLASRWGLRVARVSRRHCFGPPVSAPAA